MTTQDVTSQAIQFIRDLTYDKLSDESLTFARRCIVDTVGLYVAGGSEHSVEILIANARSQGGRADATLLGSGGFKVPASLAARVLGTSGHAHDWDDTQVSHDPAHVYGLLTHPSVPPLTAALVVAEKLKIDDGRAVMLAFQAGFEVECKIAEWMKPIHYRRGHHTSGTVGTFGACVAAAKLLGLADNQIANALGIAASFAAGIRASFGTMTKPLHVGRACENGITAALLAQSGFEADPTSLDGPWGFFSVMAEGFTSEKMEAAGFGNPLTIIDPGVSIKPYPSGILTHQSMDAMRSLVRTHDLKPEEVQSIRFYAGKNITEPIRYPIAQDHLQAKFSMPALLAIIVLKRRASHHEFTDDFVTSPTMQNMQKRIQVINDPAIDALGYDKIRSRIEVVTEKRGTLIEFADERYRGGPSNPISDSELEEKFRMCAEGLLAQSQINELYDLAAGLDKSRQVLRLAQLLGSKWQTSSKLDL